jgi:hypothetical protein
MLTGALDAALDVETRDLTRVMVNEKAAGISASGLPGRNKG